MLFAEERRPRPVRDFYTCAETLRPLAPNTASIVLVIATNAPAELTDILLSSSSRVTRHQGKQALEGDQSERGRGAEV